MNALLSVLLALSVAVGGDASALKTWSGRQQAPMPHPAPADGYRFVAQAFAEIAAAVEAHPGVVDVEIVGHTHDGRPIWAFHVADPGTSPERDVLVFGGIHALEWISTEVATDVLVGLIASPPPGVRVTVIPLLNPDGREKVEADLVAGRNAYRRGNEKNVDLNRDFAVNAEAVAVWKAILPGYYAHSDTPLSQPESQALDALAGREIYDRAASLHAFGGFFYYPWSGRFEAPPDRADFVALGRAMEQAQGNHAYKTRQLARWGFFFRAQGSELDHLYGSYGTRAFLIELTRSGLRGPKTWKSYFRWYNPGDPTRHREAGVAAVRALITHPTLPGERENPVGTPRTP